VGKPASPRPGRSPRAGKRPLNNQIGLKLIERHWRKPSDRSILIFIVGPTDGGGPQPP
jgi:hypothetical protein